MNDDESLQARADMERMQYDMDEREERSRARIETLEGELRATQLQLTNALGQAVAKGRKHALVRGALLQIMSLQDGVMIEAQLQEMRKTITSLAGVGPDNDAVRVTLYAIAVLLGEVE